MVADTLLNLGLVLKAQGNYEEAKKLFIRALTIGEETLGPKHPSVATMLMNIGTVETRQGNYDKAKRLFIRALAIGEETLGTEHPSVALTLTNLGRMLAENEKYQEAYTYVKRALAIREKRFPPHHPNLVNSSIPLFIKVATKLEKKNEVKRYIEHLKTITKKQASIALEGKATPSELNGLAWGVVDPDRSYKDTDVVLALMLVRKAVKAKPNNAAYQDTLAWALFANGKYKEAIKASKRALKLAPEPQKKEYQGYLKKIKSRVAKKQK